jgi:PAS domain S-box-containing protein
LGEEEKPGFLGEEEKPGFLGEEEKPGFSTDSLVPVGIVTERDIVQYQLLELNLAELPASKVMSAPLYCVSAEDSLYTAQQQMARLRVRRLVVRENNGSLAGIVTQTSLLQTLSPIELYATVRVLEQQVSQLEGEKLEVLKKSNSELSELNRQLQFTQFAVDNAVVPIYWVDSEGRFLYVNEAAGTSLGYSKEELLSMRVVDIDPNLSADGWGAIWRELKKQKSFQVEVFHQRKDGSIFPVEISCNYLEFQGREYSCSVGRDLSDRYQAEAALRDSEEKFRQLADNIDSVFWMSDPQMEELFYISPAYERIWGRSQASLYASPRAWLDAIHPEDLETAIAQLSERARLGSPPGFVNEYRILRPDGEVRYISDRSFAARNSQGEVYRLLGIAEDITERKLAEAELHRSQALLRAAVTNAPIILYGADAEGVQTLCEGKGLEAIGLDPGETVGRSIFDVCAGYPYILENLREVLRGSRKHWQAEFKDRIFENRATPMLDESGRVTGLIGVAIDISDRYRAERELVQLNQELELRVQERTQELQAEIRERQQVEVALRESEERFRTVFEQAAVGIDICDLQGRFVRVNQKLCDIFGYTTEELQELTFIDLTHPDDRSSNTVRLQSLLAGEISTFSIEKRYLHKGGYLIWANVTVSLLRDGTGQAQYYIGVIQDIGDRKQAELGLKQSEEMFRAIFEQAAVGIACCDASHKLIKVNQKFCEIVGYSQEELKQLSYADITYPEDLEVERKLAACIEPTAPVSLSLEKRYICKNGELVWVNLTASLLPNLKQSIFGIAVVQDINDRKLMEEELRGSREKYKTLFEILPIGVAIADKDGNILQANPASEKILGKSIVEEKPLNIRNLEWEIIRPNGSKMPATEWACLQALRKNIVVKNQEAGIVKADGNIAWMSITAAPIPLVGYGVAIAYVDITERKQIEQMKEEFLAVASHELRTPLTSLRGSLGLLATGKLGSLSDSGKRLLEFALLDTERLVRLVKDILDLQHLKSGKKILNFQTCQADLLLERAAKIVRPIAEKAEVNLSVNAVSIPVVADGDALIQVLTNLLDNAIKFSEKGSTVWAIARQHPEGVLFVVKDSGRGIPADKLETIFQPFGQADASDSRDRGGTGLGLPICRTIVQQHGGRIWVESTPGVGSSFYVLLTDNR